jgi:hypothetical protein
MAVAWSWAFVTPFKWTKQVASHYGGTREGMVISWPNRIKDVRNANPAFVFDPVSINTLKAKGITFEATFSGFGNYWVREP